MVGVLNGFCWSSIFVSARKMSLLYQDESTPPHHLQYSFVYGPAALSHKHLNSEHCVLVVQHTLKSA